MICDELTEAEVLEAFLIYASLHGYCCDLDSVQAKVEAYCQRGVPDERIDEAVLAYLDDEVVAPPEVVIPRWGCSRLYEVVEYIGTDSRHATSEPWFQNGCRFPIEGGPAIAHFWTLFRLDVGISTKLSPGTRLRFQLADDPARTYVGHRTLGHLGDLPEPLSRQLHEEHLCKRHYLPLVDREADVTAGESRNPLPSELELPGWDMHDARVYRLLVISADSSVPKSSLLDYATSAFSLKRLKC